MTRVIATGILLTFALGAMPTPASASTTTPPEPAACATTAIVATRGSAEKQVKDTDGTKLAVLTADGWEGGLGRKALLAYEAEAKAQQVDITTTKVIGIGEDDGYMAQDVEGMALIGGGSWFWNGGPDPYSQILVVVMKGAKTAAKGAARAIQQERNAALDRGCALPRILTMGYSQGAMGARILKTSPAEIHAMLSFGDPLQTGKPTASSQKMAGLTGAGADGSGTFVVSASRYEANAEAGKPVISKLTDVYDEDIPRFLECHDSDLFCDYSNLLSLGDQVSHGNYLEKKSEKKNVGEWLLDNADASEIPPVQPESTTAEPGVDANVTPWWARSESRLKIEGVPKNATVKFEVVEFKEGVDPWDPSLKVVSTLTAIPGPDGVTGSRGHFFDAPDEVPQGTHGIAVPEDLQWGGYNLRYVTKGGARMSDSIYIENPEWPHDWFWQDQFPDGRYPMN